MNILFFSDLHGDFNTLRNLKKKAKDAEIIGCAGDITMMESDMRKVLEELNSLGKPLLLIPGNHEDEDGLKEMCAAYSNIIYLHKGVHHINDYVFLGYGGDGFSKNDPDFDIVANSFFKPEAEGKRRIILLTHGPAYDTVIDKIYDDPRGNISYRRFIDDVKPHLVISGHLHENAGKHHKIGRTLFINPGKDGVFVNI